VASYLKQFSIDFAGRNLVIETGEVAKQAGGSVLVRYGDTVVLATSTASRDPREGIDFFPLTVDYEERLYSVGKIPGGFIKREGRPSEKAILAGRLIDRAIRPLFPKGFRNDVQVIATVLSVDQDNAPEIAAMIGASTALTISDIPFDGPVAVVEMGLVDGTLVVNPTSQQSDESALSLYVAGTSDAVMMVEAGAEEVPETQVLEAMIKGHEEVQRITGFIAEIAKEVGKPKREVPLYQVDETLEEKIREFATVKMKEAIMNADKLLREDLMAEVEENTVDHFLEEYPEAIKDIKNVVGSIQKEIVRDSILDRGYRPDGRQVDEVRTVTCQVAYLPRVHGSGLFTRGQTQVLTVVTLGPLGMFRFWMVWEKKNSNGICITITSRLTVSEKPECFGDLAVGTLVTGHWQNGLFCP
jgi:polyribonucleotide nucleotidyltransferase